VHLVGFIIGIQVLVFRRIQCDSGSSVWHLIIQAEANSFGLLAAVVTDMTRVSNLAPAAHPNMSKISVRASQGRYLKANPLKLLREVAVVFRQNYSKLSFTVGRDSAIGIANGYGLGGPGI